MEETGWWQFSRRVEQLPASPILAAATDCTQARLSDSSSSSLQKTDFGRLSVTIGVWWQVLEIISPPQQGGQVVAKGRKLLVTLYNLTNGSALTTLLPHPQVPEENVEAGEEGLLLVQHLLLFLLVLHGVVHLDSPRLPPPWLVLCVMADGG